MVASWASIIRNFTLDVPERLETVGYACSMSVKTYGVEWKRGDLAEAAAREAGLGVQGRRLDWKSNIVSRHA